MEPTDPGCVFFTFALKSLLCLYFEVSGDGDVTVLLSGGPIPCQLCAEDDGEGHSGTQSLQGIESSNVAATEAVSVLNHLSNILVWKKAVVLCSKLLF